MLVNIESDLKPSIRSSGIPNILKLAGTLRFLAEGSYQRGTGRDRHIGFAQPTVSVVLKEVLTAIESKLCSKWIKLTMSEAEKAEAKNHFYKKSGIPGVVGN